MWMKPSARKVSALSLAFLLATASVNLKPKEAQAMAAAALWNPVFAIAGAAAIGAGVAQVVGSNYVTPQVQSCPADCVRFDFVLMITGIISLAGGVLMLDGQGDIHYAPLYPEQAARLSISPAELTAYNQNLEEINAVEESVVSDLVATRHPSAEFARKRWEAYGANLDADALAAVKKVSAAQNFRTLGGV